MKPHFESPSLQIIDLEWLVLSLRTRQLVKILHFIISQAVLLVGNTVSISNSSIIICMKCYWTSLPITKPRCSIHTTQRGEEARGKVICLMFDPIKKFIDVSQCKKKCIYSSLYVHIVKYRNLSIYKMNNKFLWLVYFREWFEIFE